MELSGASTADLQKMLHFVIVGGGPTGVELSAELSDFVKNDVQARFPRVAEHVQITLVEALPRVLNMFDESLSNYAVEHLAERGVEVLTRCDRSSARPVSRRMSHKKCCVRAERAACRLSHDAPNTPWPRAPLVLT